MKCVVCSDLTNHVGWQYSQETWVETEIRLGKRSSLKTCDDCMATASYLDLCDCDYCVFHKGLNQKNDPGNYTTCNCQRASEGHVCKGDRLRVDCHGCSQETEFRSECLSCADCVWLRRFMKCGDRVKD